MQNNPLQKYYRQPKIYLNLPSGGNFYPPGVVTGDPTNLPVFGMTAMDEIMFKTPDALFTGEASVSVIQSCIPAITQPWLMPQIDVDACLIAIRIATYGQTIETSFTCGSCGEDNTFDLDLSKSLEYFVGLEYPTQVLVGPLMVTLRPLTYREVTKINVNSFELQRQLYQSASSDETPEEKNKRLNDVYKEIAELTSVGFKSAIQSVETDDVEVSDTTQIEEWLKHSDKEFFDKIKEHLEGVKDKWTLPSQTVECASCGSKNKSRLGLDNSDFFVSR